MTAAAPASPERATLPLARRLLLALMLASIGLPLPLTLVTEIVPPAVQRMLRSPALFGFVAGPPPVVPGIGEWWRGDFQRALDGWFARNLEPRGWGVRVTNQLYYTAFRRSYMYRSSIIVGRDSVLYERAYLEAYCKPGPGEAELAPLVAKIAGLREDLAGRGHTLLFLVTPSKAVTMPEFLPAGLCDPPPAPERRGQTLVALLRRAGVPVIDGATLARAMKTQDPLPPFPRGGTHWSRLVGARVAALAMAEIGRLAGTDLGTLGLGEPRWDAPPIGTDADLAVLLNLLIPPLDYPTGEAELECRPTPAGQAADLIGVGGSFLGQVMRPIGLCGLFDRAEHFGYYKNYRIRYPDGLHEQFDRTALDWAALLGGRVVLLLELNERRIEPGIPWLEKFIEDAQAALR